MTHGSARAGVGLHRLATIGWGLVLVLVMTCTRKTETRSAPGVAATYDAAAVRARWRVMPNPTAAATLNHVWWEAEQAVRTDFSVGEGNPFAPEDDSQAAVLSGGAWIGVGQSDVSRHAEYDVTVPASATYDLYVRKFWQHGPFSWRFGSGPSTFVARRTALLDAVTMRPSVGAHWVFAGEARLEAGRQSFFIDVAADAGAAAFDAFLLIDGPFVPRGKRRPGEPYEPAPAGWFVFDPPADAFAESAIDLSDLNTPIRGEASRLFARAGGFVRADGSRERLWGVNAAPAVLHLSDKHVEAYARRMAKAGVNSIRLHGPVWRDDDPRKSPDPVVIDRIKFAASVFARYGIYTSLSIYYSAWLQLDAKSAVPGYNGEHTHGLPYTSDAFEVMYREWWRELLTTPNPYSGTPLAADPSVVSIELVNEDSTLFWSFAADAIPPAHWKTIEKRYATWLHQRHGDLGVVQARWQDSGNVPERFGVEGVELLPLWDMFTKRTLRGQDQARFLTELMRNWYARTYRYVKDQLGYRGNVVCSNWLTGDARVLGPLEKYANGVCDVLDRHGYHIGFHDGENAGWMLASGQRYASESALKFERRDHEHPENRSLEFAHPVLDIAYGDKPSIISEIGWARPNAYRADLPLTSAAYGALQDSDAFYFFTTDAPTWESQRTKFGLQSPVIMGQFPAAASIYRRGLVQVGDVVARLGLALPRLFALQGSPLASSVTLDQLRTADVPRSGSTSSTGIIDPLASLVGRVHVEIGERGEPLQIANLDDYVDHDTKVIRSTTGELTWDYGRGSMVIDAPRAQGVTGFLALRGVVETAAAQFEIGLEYGAAVLVALDDRPLVRSERILLQLASTETNRNWTETAVDSDLLRIDDVGGPPLYVREMAGVVRLRREDVHDLRATALDYNGYPVRRLEDLTTGIPLLTDVSTYLIELRSPDQPVADPTADSPTPSLAPEVVQ